MRYLSWLVMLVWYFVMTVIALCEKFHLNKRVALVEEENQKSTLPFNRAN